MSNTPTGIKNDKDKPRMELLSPIAVREIAKVMTFGAKKYAAHNWRGGIVWSRVLGAALRHMFSFLGGEDKDPETGLSHLAHAGCCIMFLLEYEVTHQHLDDRYKQAEAIKEVFNKLSPELAAEYQKLKSQGAIVD